MDWFISSILAIFAISAGWLSLKYAQNKGESNEDALIKYISFVILAVLVWIFFNKIPLVISNPFHIFLLILAAVAASASNLILMKSFKKSSNQGLSLSLFSTQIIWLTLISFIFLNGSLSFLSVFGIFLIFFGIMAMYLKNSGGKFRWGVLALLAGILATIYWVLVRIVQITDPSLSPSIILLYVVVPQLFIFIIVRKKKAFSFSGNFFLPSIILAIGGIIGAVGNSLSIFAVSVAPNPGYSQAITSSYVLLNLFASGILFKSKLEKKQIIAAILIFIGIVIIKLGS
jgi:drug/metabolite transporter (DMT)-like permease